MIGFNILLTGLIVLMALALIESEFGPRNAIAYTIIVVAAILASTAVFSGALMVVWSL